MEPGSRTSFSAGARPGSIQEHRHSSGRDRPGPAFPVLLAMHSMLPTLTGALALVVLGSLPLAQSSGPQDAAPVLGPVGAAESSALALVNDLEVGALVRAFWGIADDDLADFDGFDFYDVDIWAQLPLEGFDFRISFDAEPGLAVLEDAYVHYVHDQQLAARIGNFKPRVLFTNSVDPELQVFNDRSVLGTFFDVWDIGLQASGQGSGGAERLRYFGSITNGSDGTDDDQAYVLRGEWSVHGSNLPLQEGMRGHVGEQEIELGLVFVQDSGDDATGFGLDVLARHDKFSGQFEVMNLDDDLAGLVGLKIVPVVLDGDATPWALSGAALVSDQVQIGARIQDTDNDDDTTILSVAVDYFPNDGPLVVIGQLDRYDDVAGEDGFVLQVGVSMGSSRPRP